ncbi:Transglycosylase SLT domain-containing protein [Parafrankia irregularis]|uniref:Transglycosylase SLT domain-containing protein n=1 Tax=Parafrankia irregularis TaxID=795642 RepID=A0A0S4QZW9_9ACTN|nr:MULTISPECIES: C40 family peptidase [Parafrankia]CUU60719.1 Transglycosylase SLT domain-containing protein [Parafrankia irregularis]
MVLLIVMMGAAAGAAQRVLCLPVVGWFLGCNSGGSPSQTALDDIPADYLNLYLRAAPTCPGLSWTTLAAIGKVESDHGRSRLPGVASGTNSAGAGGTMQFLATTFAEVVARHPLPAGGANPPSLYNAQDAVYAAAFYLCDNHVAADLTGALWAYNHSDAYVAQVVTQATEYSSTGGDFGADTAPSDAGYAAVIYAQGQLGIPYLWGGDGPQLTELPDGRVKVTGGFDCSGLTRAAYAAAGVNLPRTAQQQYEAGPLVPASSVLQPGDLLFFGTGPGDVTHVGIAISSTQMINAPHRGAVVRIDSIWRNLVGVTRPADRG